MAAITADSTVTAILDKFARAGVRHPIDLTKEFTGATLVLTFSMGDDDETPTVVLSSTGSHDWPFASEPERTFDDRALA